MKHLIISLELRGAHHRSAGFSLLEVLVALLIISVSLLGVAGMQAVSIANTGESGYRSIAATQANLMAARMSANTNYWQPLPPLQPGILTVPATATVVGSAVTLGGIAATAPSLPFTTGCSLVSPCTPQNLALLDLSDWGKQLAAALPSGNASIACANSGAATMVTCTITVKWNEKDMVQNQVASASATAYTAADLVVVVQP